MGMEGKSEVGDALFNASLVVTLFNACVIPPHFFVLHI